MENRYSNNTKIFKTDFDFISPDADKDSCQILVNNSENILKVLRNLYVEKQMCDVFFKVGNREYGAHRIILCASSDVFQVMLMKPEWSEWHESRVELQEISQCETVFPQFLEYFYTGKILIMHTNVMPILALADKYIVKGLSRLCLEYMYRHAPHAASYNHLFSWLQYVLPCGHTEVANVCKNYIKWNFEAIANSPDFSNFDPEMFVDILLQNDMVVYNEMVLYNCVVMWLDLQKVKFVQADMTEEQINNEMKELVENVMNCIRFPMMSPRDLADLLLSPLIKQHKEFFVDRMAIGMAFHSGQVDRIHDVCSSKEGRSLFKPRLYTSDTYSTILAIENFGSIPFYHTSTFVFSSHTSAADREADKINEWVVDLYPKGVWFKQCLLISWQGTLEVPEEIVPTVRLTLTCREMCEPNMRLKVAVLIYGLQGGVEHIMDVRQLVCHFNSEQRVINIDNIIPFEELNPPAGKPKSDCAYLIGADRDQLKFHIVITPFDF